MAVVNVQHVLVLNNPATFYDPLAFDIQYECTAELESDLEWKMIYVGSAESEEYDQVLDSVLVGPVLPGNYRFVFEASHPDPTRLQPDDIVGVTVILLTCSYKGKEFIRIGYYVNHEYTDEALREEPPAVPAIDKLARSILADHPRVTRFPNDFDSPPAPLPCEEGMEGVEGMEQGQQGFQVEQGGEQVVMGPMDEGMQGGEQVVMGPMDEGMHAAGGMMVAEDMAPMDAGMQDMNAGMMPGTGLSSGGQELMMSGA